MSGRRVVKKKNDEAQMGLLDTQAVIQIMPDANVIKIGGKIFIDRGGAPVFLFFLSSRRRHTRSLRDWSSDVCSSDLDRVLARHGRLVLGECWPELALVGCWLGGSAGIQARHLTEHVDPRVARRDLGFVASEGRLTIPLEDGTAAGVLAVHA